jgi:hypothetical protein
VPNIVWIRNRSRNQIEAARWQLGTALKKLYSVCLRTQYNEKQLYSVAVGRQLYGSLLDEQICLALRPLILHKLIIETATAWVVLQALYTLLKTTCKLSVILTVNLRLIFLPVQILLFWFSCCANLCQNWTQVSDHLNPSAIYSCEVSILQGRGGGDLWKRFANFFKYARNPTHRLHCLQNL